MYGVLAMRLHGLTHELSETTHLWGYGEVDCRWLFIGESYTQLTFWLGYDGLDNKGDGE